MTRPPIDTSNDGEIRALIERPQRSLGLHRYVYLGDRLTDPALVGQPCDPVRRADGKCIVSVRMATALVRFPDGVERVVARRRLRVRKVTT